MKRLSLAFLGLIALAALGCHAVGPQHQLLLSMIPPDLRPGEVLVVTARPMPQAQLLWVSGTVDVMGSPDYPFSKDPVDGLWKFKMGIPVFASIPPGDYQAKAWGKSVDGQRFDGTLIVHVK